MQQAQLQRKASVSEKDGGLDSWYYEIPGRASFEPFASFACPPFPNKSLVFSYSNGNWIPHSPHGSVGSSAFLSASHAGNQLLFLVVSRIFSCRPGPWNCSSEMRNAEWGVRNGVRGFRIPHAGLVGLRRSFASSHSHPNGSLQRPCSGGRACLRRALARARRRGRQGSTRAAPASRPAMSERKRPVVSERSDLW